MHRLKSWGLALGIILAASGPVWALNPASVDILGFRLGMSLAEVRAGLAAQGLAGRAHEQGMACPDATDTRCVPVIRIRTKDGVLTLRMTSGTTGAVDAIVYALDGRGAGEPAMISAAVTERFGRPDSLHPMAWCRQPMGAPSCPPDGPRLTFAPGPDRTSVLTLSRGSAGGPSDASAAAASDVAGNSRK
ncbi:MAG TPA: hypothetical protein VN702_16065 [Acetobacteraceae bacterium]|nr:hypothetical protein [Acetobacteraceae bacterium]